jgi:hypothetical protein
LNGYDDFTSRLANWLDVVEGNPQSTEDTLRKALVSFHVEPNQTSAAQMLIGLFIWAHCNGGLDQLISEAEEAMATGYGGTWPKPAT